jgi:hypothetical protein
MTKDPALLKHASAARSLVHTAMEMNGACLEGLADVDDYISIVLRGMQTPC